MKKTILIISLIAAGLCSAQVSFYTADTLLVTWRANATCDSVTHYNVFTNKIKSHSTIDTSWRVTGLTGNTDFNVTAVNRHEESPFSKTVIALFLGHSFQLAYTVDDLAQYFEPGVHIPGFRLGLWNGKTVEIPVTVQKSGRYRIGITAAPKGSFASLDINGEKVVLFALQVVSVIQNLTRGANYIYLTAEADIHIFNIALTLEYIGGVIPVAPEAEVYVLPFGG